MQDHWLEYGPPVYVSVASYLGLVKPDKKKAEQDKPPEASSDENLRNLEALEQQLNSTGGVI